MPLDHLKTLPVRIDWESNIPPFSQIAGRIYCIIQAGQLADGDLLPQIRVLARQLDANPNTVARAYDELEQLGVLRKRQGSGCFVCAQKRRPSTARERLEPLRGRIEELVADAQMIGLTTEELIAAIRDQAPEIVAQEKHVPRRPAANAPPRELPRREPAPPPRNLWQPADSLVD